jgi:tetratricopeptide (TPR) repeat protein
MRCFDLSVVVWGDVHTGIFLDVGLPSLLSPGNLPGLASLAEARLLLFTRTADLRRMETSAPFRLLRSLTTVETILMDRWFDGEQKPSPHALMSRAHRESFKAAFERKADVLFIPPECVWADGSMVHLEKVVNEKPVRIVHISGIRLVLESFAPQLIAEWRSADAATLTIPSRELVEAGIAHLHPIMRDHFFEEMGDDLVPSNLLWWAGDEGIVARCFHLHPLLVAPDQRNEGFRRTIDDDLPMSGDGEHEYVVSDSDEIFVYELSSINHRVQAGYVKASVSDIAAWGEVAANTRHRQLVRTVIRIHGEHMTPDLWASVERRAETIVADAMELIGKPTRQLLALHENVVAHRALAAKYGGSTFAAWLKSEALSLDETPPQLRAWVHEEIAAAHKERGDLDQAIAEYTEAIRAAEFNAQDYGSRAISLAERTNWKAALATVEAGLSRSRYDRGLRALHRWLRQRADRGETLPSNSLAAPFLAGCEGLVRSDTRVRELRVAGDIAGVVAEYDKCIASEGGGPALYYLRGTALAETGRHEAALADFEASLALQPDNLTVAFVAERERLILCDMRARERRAAGDLAGALAEYQKSISSGSGNPTLYYLRGSALAEMGEHAAALVDFEAALALEPDNPTLSFVAERERLILSDTPVKKLLRGLRFAQMRIYARLFFRRDEPRPWHPAWLGHRARVRAVCRAIPADTRIAVLVNADGLLLAGLRRLRPRLSVVTQFTGSAPATQTHAPAIVPRLWLPPLGDVEQPIDGAPALEAAEPRPGIAIDCYAGPGTEISHRCLNRLRKGKGALSDGPLRFAILGIGVIVFPVALPVATFAILVGNMAGLGLDGLSSLKIRLQRRGRTERALNCSPGFREQHGAQGTQGLHHAASEVVLEADCEGEDRGALAPLRAAGAPSVDGP